MKKDEILDRLVSYKGGGVATDETYPNRQYFDSRLHSLREFALREEYRRDRTISEQYYMNHWLFFDENVNNGEYCGSKFYTFYCPTVLRVAEHISGFGYVGSEDMMKPYELYTSPEKFSNAMRNRATRLNIKRNVVAYYENGYEEIRLSAPVKKGLVRGIFMRPESVPTFNDKEDEYPISGKGLELLEEAITRGTISYLLRVPQDKLPNSQTDSDLQKTGVTQPR
jgi:hypothetical protein